jgi:lipid II:glycine glycyltransferase (peptidoglycan interpeptide bridge formation enzyme)
MNSKDLDLKANTLVLDPQDVRWIEFIKSHPQANIFHHPAWINLLSECYGYHPFIVIVEDAEGLIKAGVPVLEVNSFLTGRRWVSLPFSDYCVPLSQDEESLGELTDWFINAYQGKEIPKIELRWELPATDSMQQNSNNVFHTIALSEDSEEVVKRFKRSHRQNIRTAEKRGVHVEKGDKLEHLQLYYQLQLETRQRLGVPAQPRRFFELMADHLFKQGLGFVLLAYKDNECLAGIVFLCFGKSIVAKYAASRTDTLKLRPNNLIFWSGIKWGCENGYSIFELGRTEASNSGLCRYKRGWGAVEKPLTYSTLPIRQDQTESGKLQNMMQKVIRKSPVWVCQAAGELLYKHYG